MGPGWVALPGVGAEEVAWGSVTIVSATTPHIGLSGLFQPCRATYDGSRPRLPTAEGQLEWWEEQ